MSFLLATLNPPSRRRRGKRRTARRARRLTAWQKMVKKYGGVMEALKHRRSAGSRTRVRGRRRVLPLSRRNAMARVKRRRRNAWRGHGRLHRLAALKGWRKRRHGRRRGRNPWTSFKIRRFRSARTGQFTSKHAPRARRNPVVPVSWNPRKRRKARRRRNAVVPVSWNPRRRRARRNPILPFEALTNPAAGVLGKAQSFLDVRFWMETAVPAAGGFIGTKMVGSMIDGALKQFTASLPDVAQKVVRIGSDVLAASGLAWLAGRFLGKKYGDAIFIGGVVGITHSVLKEVLGGTAIGNALGLSGLGADLSERMREAVAKRVEAELSGMGAYLTQEAFQPQALAGVGAFLTEQAMVPQMVTDRGLRASRAFSPSPSGSIADYNPASESLEL